METLKFRVYAFIVLVAAIGIEQANSFKEFIPFIIVILIMILLLIGSHFIDKTLKK